MQYFSGETNIIKDLPFRKKSIWVITNLGDWEQFWRIFFIKRHSIKESDTYVIYVQI